jgi:hypothetical protein
MIDGFKNFLPFPSKNSSFSCFGWKNYQSHPAIEIEMQINKLELKTPSNTRKVK